MGVASLGQGVVESVRVEVFAALGTEVLRVNEFDVVGPIVNQIAHIMQQPSTGPVSKARFATTWARYGPSQKICNIGLFEKVRHTTSKEDTSQQTWVI